MIRRAVQEGQREEVAQDNTELAPEMLGQAPAIHDVLRAIGRFSESAVTVADHWRIGLWQGVGGEGASQAITG